MHLEHVNLTVADLDRSIAFYREALGLPLRWSGRTAAGRRAAHVGTGGFYLAFFEAAPGGAGGVQEADYDRVGFNHFGLVVGDLDAARGRLRERGVEPHAEMDYEPGRRLYFVDPDGFEVELVEYAAAAARGAQGNLAAESDPAQVEEAR